MRYFNGRGVNVAAVATFDRRDDRDAARISGPSIETAVQRLATTKGVEAIFVSCTSLRVAEAAAGLERKIGAPVTSSNHAMAWHCLRTRWRRRHLACRRTPVRAADPLTHSTYQVAIERYYCAMRNIGLPVVLDLFRGSRLGHAGPPIPGIGALSDAGGLGRDAGRNRAPRSRRQYQTAREARSRDRLSDGVTRPSLAA